MRYRRAATFAFLIAAIGCMVYFAIGAYVRSTSDESLKRAAIALQRGRPEQARDELAWLMWFDPRDAAAAHLTGLSYLREENLPAAIEHLESVGAESRVHEEAQLSLAAALLADRQFQRAEEILRSVLSRYPHSLLACRQLSGILLTELRQRDAVAVLEGFLQRAETESISRSDRLLLLRDLSTAEFHPPLPSTCLPVLKESLKRHPDQPQVQLALGTCLWEEGFVTEAEPLLRAARRQRPDDLHTRLVVCRFLLELGQIDDAEAALTSTSGETAVDDVIQQDDRFWELRCRLAEQRTDYETALQAIDRAISIRPSDKAYVSRRGRVLQRLNRIEDSRRAHERAHELSRAELDLWDLSRDVGVREPTPADCEQVSQIYEVLGKPLQAAAWRRLAE